MKKSSKIIVFLGVDGSGKSTLINIIYKRHKSKFNKIHFVPDYFRNKKNILEKNPHSKKKRGKIFSFLKLIYWIINIKFSEFFQIFSNKNYIYDRNLSDVLIDPVRYKFNLSNNILSFFINSIKQPDLYVYVTGNIKKIYNRKKETSYINLIKLDKKYKKFFKKIKNKIFINGFNKKESNYEKIIMKINSL